MSPGHRALEGARSTPSRLQDEDTKGLLCGRAGGGGLTVPETVTQHLARQLQMKHRPRRLRQAFSLSQSQEILAGNMTMELGKALGNT